MNYQITRIRLASVGPEPARYDPLDLDLMNRDGSGPTDTVLFLPNTGGKTVLLRLLFSVLHPPAVEKIGSEEVTGRSRNLPGYVLERDTAHVVIEWRRAELGRFLDDECLVTGLVAEWRGGRATGNPSDLVRVWYSIRGDAERVGSDRLQFEVDVPSEDGSVRRRLPLRRFREQLAEMAKGDRRGLPVVTITEVQRDWIRHLDDLGLDGALFRYQGEMNHNEAGASAIARFTKDIDFVDFFLKAVMDPAELAVLDREFEEVADKVRRYPEYERRLRFEEAALAELDPMASEVAAAAAAHERTEAARRAASELLAAFLGGAKLVQEREGMARQRERERDVEARRLASLADRNRDEWREFRRLGAAMLHHEMDSSYREAESHSEAAELDVRAWSISEDLVRHQEAAAEVRVLNEEYALEQDRLRPLREDRDAAGRDLARCLLAAVVLADAETETQRSRAISARSDARRLREEQQAALLEAVRLDAAREADEQRLAEVRARRDPMVSEGVLGAAEPAAVARDRESDRAEIAFAQIKAIDARIDELEAERATLDETDRTAAARVRDAQRDHDLLAASIGRAESERAGLVAEPVVSELAEAEAFDLEVIGPAIATRLLGRADEADKQRLMLEMQGADDRRAIRALDENRLLPPPPDVVEAISRLSAAGIAGAMPGTHYLAEAIRDTRRAEVAARRGDLAGGIVLTDPGDLGRARSILENAALDPTMVVTVGPAVELAETEDHSEPRRRTFVVPPAPALWDRTAAGAERERRQSRIDSLEDERGRLDEQARGSRTLAADLTRHAISYPTGWLAARRAERDTLVSELARLAAERAKRHERREAIGTDLRGLREESSAAQRDAREAERRAGALGRLAEEELSTVELPAKLERQRTEAEDWRSSARESSRAAEVADAQADEAVRAAADQQSAASRLRSEAGRVRLADPVSDPARSEAEQLVAAGDLTDLRVRFRELDQRLAGETSASDVAARRSAAIRTRDDIAAVIQSHPAPVRERAEALITLPEAGDLPGRRAAAERAVVAAEAARAAAREVFASRAQAQKSLNEIEEEVRMSRRRAEIPAERTPGDRHHAARLAAEARQHAETVQSRAADAEKEQTAARTAADDARRTLDGLASLATSLRMGLNLAADAPLLAIAPYLGDLESARAAGEQASRDITDSATAEDLANRSWRARDSALRALLAREEFADLAASDRLYRRLAQSPAETLARDAADLGADLRSSIGILQTDLATLAQDVKLATTSLAKSVNKAISYLRLAETRSKMPASLRDWGGEPFLVIRFERPPADQLEARLATFVTEIINRPAARPTGSLLLLQALERAVGAFSVRILKPNEAFAPTRVPVAELSSPTFSNGQRSTVATALMLMLSELRRRSRSSSHGTSVGALLLDNPFGNANAGFLIEVQRTVAAAAGIQLVYTTGIADLNALRRFPNVIALSNDAARRTMRRYVRANPALLNLLVPSDQGPGGRISAARALATAKNERDQRA